MTDVDMYDEVLGLGKVRQEVLRRSVFSMLPLEAEPTLDGGTISMGGRTVIAHSPSIGVPLDALGFFAFHYAASNVAARFARPKHLVTGIYLPLKTREKELRTITSVLGEEARKFGVTVVAGQTATYYGLEIPLVTSTCFGEPVRQPEDPQPGDVVMIVGAVGGEAVWLSALSKGAVGGGWREFTPLRAALRLQEVGGVRLMHDVSEGGVMKALGEVSEATGVRVEVESDRIFYAEGARGLGQDVLRAPTYGALIVIAKPGVEGEAEQVCRELGTAVASVGFIKEGSGVYVDGDKVEVFDRIALDEIYGSFEERDETLNAIRGALAELEGREEVSSLIPQVGMNLVYAKYGASSIDDVGGIAGRIVRSKGKPRVCGDVAYGVSEFMASVVLEAMKLDPVFRAAINIRGGEDVVQALRDMGTEIKVLAPEASSGVCPVTVDIRNTGELFQAYYHPGGFGVEPTTTLIGENPLQLVMKVIELARYV